MTKEVREMLKHLPICIMWAMWPDLAKLRNLGNILVVLGKIVSVYFVFGKIWTNFDI